MAYWYDKELMRSTAAFDLLTLPAERPKPENVDWLQEERVRGLLLHRANVMGGLAPLQQELEEAGLDVEVNLEDDRSEDEGLNLSAGVVRHHLHLGRLEPLVQDYLQGRKDRLLAVSKALEAEGEPLVDPSQENLARLAEAQDFQGLADLANLVQELLD